MESLPMSAWVLAIPVLPAAAWLLLVLGGRRAAPAAPWLATSAAALSALATWVVFLERPWEGIHGGIWEGPWSWGFFLSSGGDGIAGLRATLSLDAISGALLPMVGTVAFLVHLFSVRYMRTDPRPGPYFAGLALFTASMAGMLLVENLLFFFVFWELMGFCSWLLIGHDSLNPSSPRPEAARAARKAFLTTRVGDLALLLGMVVLWKGFGTLSFTELAVAGGSAGSPPWLLAGGGLLLLGAMGKSAQFPLHVWLPDAMEGPTPVSAMIHAATMVAAGVILLVRSAAFLPDEILLAASVVGALTAFFAGTVALVSADLKKVLAWSTISQLGFMTAAVGVGGPGAALFHLNTHGFFKAGLFLAAGSVILACHHRQDLGGLGGLRRRMPMTWVAAVVCAAALSGLPWLSGFHSKEAILSLALDGAALGGLPFLTAGLLFVAAALTPVYMFRMVFLAFHGEARSTEAREASEDSWLVRLPLAVLTVLAVVSARFWLFPVEEAPASEHWAGVLGTTLALGGVILAGLLFLLPVLSPAAFARFFGPLTGLARERWKFDALYAATFPPLFRFGGRAVDGFDRRFVDGLAHGIGRMAEAGGSAFRKLHRGRIQTYALLTLAGLLLLSVTLLLQGEVG